MLWLPLLALLAGFALLTWGADRFVAGAAAIACNLGVAPLIIGLTIVGIGTSAPEMLVSAMAALAGNPGIAIGNAIGSNIINIGLVLGLTILIRPLTVPADALRREFPVLFAVMCMALLLLLDGELGRLDGIILLSGFVLMLYWLVRLAKRDRANAQNNGTQPDGTDAEMLEQMSTARAVFWVIVGLLVLLSSSRLLIWGAVDIARFFGVSDLVIGLTIVAFGTSLPELAASISSVLKGEDDLAIGNILGSNIFNLLAVLGLPGLLHPLATPGEVLSRDYPAMLIFTILLFVLACRSNGNHIKRPAGLLLLAGFCAYSLLLFYQTQ